MRKDENHNYLYSVRWGSLSLTIGSVSQKDFNIQSLGILLVILSIILLILEEAVNFHQ